MKSIRLIYQKMGKIFGITINLVIQEVIKDYNIRVLMDLKSFR